MLLTLVAVMPVSANAQNDTAEQIHTGTAKVYLKNGTILVGTIEETNASTVQLKTSSGTLNVNADDIESITYTGQDKQEEKRATVYLKNGNVINGTIIGSSISTTDVKTDFGTLHIDNGDIQNIQYAQSPAQTNGQSEQYPKPSGSTVTTESAPAYVSPPPYYGAAPLPRRNPQFEQAYWAQRRVNYLISRGTMDYIIAGLWGVSALASFVVGSEYQSPSSTAWGIASLGFGGLWVYFGYSNFALADQIKRQYNLSSSGGGSLIGYNANEQKLNVNVPLISSDTRGPDKNIKLSLLTVKW